MPKFVRIRICVHSWDVRQIFEQLDTLMNSEHDLRDLQEIIELSRGLLGCAEEHFERKLRDDVCDSIPFLSNADCHVGKCGQCGDDVYWNYNRRCRGTSRRPRRWCFYEKNSKYQ